MVDYGLIVKNTSGGIQIDSKYRNLSFDSSGTSTISNNNTEAGWLTTVGVTASSLTPLILLRPGTSWFTAIRSYDKSGSNYTGFKAATFHGQSQSVDWQCLRENRTASGDSYGMLVYNANGDLCFDSGKRYFKINSVQNISLGTPYWTTSTTPNSPVCPYTDITHAGISDPYYILTACNWWWFSFTNKYTDHSWQASYDSSWSVFCAIGMKKLSATSVRVGWFPFGVIDNSLMDHWTGVGSNPASKLIICEAA